MPANQGLGSYGEGKRKPNSKENVRKRMRSKVKPKKK